jgi:hypothetical protein
MSKKCLCALFRKARSESAQRTYSRLLVVIVHFGETVVESVQASGVDLWLIAYTVWIFRSSQASAGRRHVLTGGRCSNSGLVLFLRDGLNAIGVVVSKLRVVDHLRIDVDTSVDKSNRVKAELYSGAHEATVCNSVVLLLKVIGKNRSPVSLIRLAPDAEAIIG